MSLQCSREIYSPHGISGFVFTDDCGLKAMCFYSNSTQSSQSKHCFVTKYCCKCSTDCNDPLMCLGFGLIWLSWRDGSIVRVLPSSNGRGCLCKDGKKHWREQPGWTPLPHSACIDYKLQYALPSQQRGDISFQAAAEAHLLLWKILTPF